MSSEIEVVEEVQYRGHQQSAPSASSSAGEVADNTPRNDVYMAAAYADLEKLRRLVEQEVCPVTEHQPPNGFSFLSKGWREVRDSADADFRLMKDRVGSVKNLATSFDRELENSFNSTAPAFSVPAMRSPSPSEIEFVKKLQPKLSEFRRVYSSPDFGMKILEKWRPRAKIRIDLSAIKNAIVSGSEEAVEDEIVSR